MEDRTNRRAYRMKERAKTQDDTRERIVAATMLLHDEQGVAGTSFVDVAKRAGIGAATVYRHFPNLGSLVAACGAHVWQEMAPPIPERAPVIFEGLDRFEDRLQRLVDELDDFYRRGALRLKRAYADRHLIPELDQFLRAVEAGVAALVREALKNEAMSGTALQLVLALTDFPVWGSMQRIECDDLERRLLVTRLLRCAIISAG
ncbi:TetR/AcrR family transcriptional regulator [Methylobacterium sp. Leaf118]|uniref:TetR/AcrR family transcriptional regulator n=1 Tax=Methylobacterium sp. Leaf118 TaxID=2876562 RepID=UPI001E37005D|nr:TetR/AcrR family transcriptional regulator [Methylobacterium sp. Leaf118]